MVYRLDALREDGLNPITRQLWDASWMILMLTDSPDYEKFCGVSGGCAYAVKVSRTTCSDWPMAVGDFISFGEGCGRKLLLVMPEEDLAAAKNHYSGHRHDEPLLRPGEPSVLVHSTPLSSWEKIQRDGMLKSWNRLKAEQTMAESQPIGAQLGDPADFSDYIMFGGGVTGEIVVNSKQQGRIVMDIDGPYQPGARLYFDAQKMAQDGLLLRDGCHIKVKDALPLSPYLIWAATWKSVGLPGPASTPRAFAALADQRFEAIREAGQI